MVSYNFLKWFSLIIYLFNHESFFFLISSVADNPLICRSSPPEICSGYYLFKSSFLFLSFSSGKTLFLALNCFTRDVKILTIIDHFVHHSCYCLSQYNNNYNGKMMKDILVTVDTKSFNTQITLVLIQYQAVL